MDRPETLHLLRSAHDEIITLRRRVAELEPKAHAYDTIAINARLTKKHQGDYAQVDVAWELKNAVEAIVAERDAEKESQTNV